MNLTSRPRGPRWVGRTFAGWCLGFLLAILCIVGTDALGFDGLQSPLAIGMGLGVGGMQAALLRSVPIRRRAWTIATVAGLALPFLAADVARQIGRPVPYSLAAYVALGGVSVAVMHGWLLRRARRRALWWTIVTPAGWMLAGSTVWLNHAVLPKTPGLVGALQYVGVVLSGGVLLGAACAIAWRLDQPFTE